MIFSEMDEGKKYRVIDSNHSTYIIGDIVELISILGCENLSDDPDDSCGRCRGQGKIVRSRHGSDSTVVACMTDDKEVEVEECQPSWKSRLINDR